jgi:hypothetical protein
MKTNRLKLFVLGLCLFEFSGFARAELATDSPPVLTGSIVSASDKIVTLKLSDGRTTKKIPRKFFPKNTDYYPGRILDLSITDEIRAALTGSEPAKDISDADLVQMIKAMHGASGKSKGIKKDRTSALDFLSISSAYAAPDLGCFPISKFGGALDPDRTRKEKACKWDEPKPCADPEAAKAAQAAATKATIFVACMPELYGTKLCAPAENQTAPDEARCGPMHTKRCEGMTPDACIWKFVLPYAASKKDAVVQYFKRTMDVCADAKKNADILDRTDCKEFNKFGATLRAQLNKYDAAKSSERSIQNCELVDVDANKDLTEPFDEKDKTKVPPRFTTISAGPQCGGQTLCVRDIVCQDPLLKSVGARRFARCHADKCYSADLCLKDTLVSGSSQTTSLPGAGAPATGAEKAHPGN